MLPLSVPLENESNLPRERSQSIAASTSPKRRIPAKSVSESKWTGSINMEECFFLLQENHAQTNTHACPHTHNLLHHMLYSKFI